MFGVLALKGFTISLLIWLFFFFFPFHIGDNRGWDGWMTSPARWTWIWASFGSFWWTGKPSVLQSMRSQRVGTRLSDWTDWIWHLTLLYCRLYFIFIFYVYCLSCCIVFSVLYNCTVQTPMPIIVKILVGWNVDYKEHISIN